MRIALIRHGRTEWNAQGRVQGAIETDLSEEGRKILSDLRIPPPFDTARAFCSPQKRARQTAALLGLHPVADARLREQSWGIWEGLTRTEMRLRDGDDCFKKNGIGLAFRPPGGEATFELVARVRSFLIDVASEDSPAIAVAHLGVLRAAYALASGWDMAGEPVGFDASAMLILNVEGESIRINTLNSQFLYRFTAKNA